MRVEYATLVMQIIIVVIVTGSLLAAHRTRRNLAKTLDALTAYRREVDWFVARLDALEKKNAEKNWQVIEGRGNGRQN
jgi:hypothetical protein